MSLCRTDRGVTKIDKRNEHGIAAPRVGFAQFERQRQGVWNADGTEDAINVRGLKR